MKIIVTVASCLYGFVWFYKSLCGALSQSVKICVNLWLKKGTGGMLMGMREPQINTN